MSGLRKRGIGSTSLHEALDTTMPGGRLVFHVFAALAKFIGELIVQGTNEGLDAARARGARLGRPPAMTEDQVRHARDLLARPENTVTSIAKLLGASRNTIYIYPPEVKGGRLALAESVTTAELPRPPGQQTDHRRLRLGTAFLPAPLFAATTSRFAWTTQSAPFMGKSVSAKATDRVVAPTISS